MTRSTGLPAPSARAGEAAGARFAEAVASDLPLPPELVGRHHGWLSAYRRWPVYSRRWARGRTVVWGAFATLFVLLITATVHSQSPSGVVAASLALDMVLSLGLPIALGPWLAHLVLVRTRGAPATAGRRIGVALAVLTAALLAFNHLATEPVKHELARLAGALDAAGERPRGHVVVGVSIDSERRAAAAAAASAASAAGAVAPSGAAAEDAMPWPLAAMNWVTKALFTFVLAGGFALPALARQQAGLEALARERALAEAEARRREAETRLSVLAAQIEPHFLFNTLAGVRGAIATDPPRAAVMIDRLVDYLRASIPRLRGDGRPDATLGAQVEAVRAYLALMRARMPRLAFRIDVPPTLAATPFPPLMLLTLAENAVQHGIEPKLGAALIGVAAEPLADGRIAVTVEDDGVGFDADAPAARAARGGGGGAGLGLVNIRERLAQMHGPAAELRLRRRGGGGTLATIVVPAAAPAPAPADAPTGPPAFAGAAGGPAR